MKSTTKVSELMATEIATCRPSDDLARAAQIMWERDCGCVPVTDDEGHVVGMLTDRDVAMASYTQGLLPHAIRVVRAMSATCSTCLADDTLESALRTMAQDQVRRLPVADGRGRLVGLLSLADVLQALGRAAPRARRSLVEPALGTLVEITRPRHEDAVLVPAEPRRARARRKPAAKASARKGSARKPAAGRSSRKRTRG